MSEDTLDRALRLTEMEVRRRTFAGIKLLLLMILIAIIASTVWITHMVITFAQQNHEVNLKLHNNLIKALEKESVQMEPEELPELDTWVPSIPEIVPGIRDEDISEVNEPIVKPYHSKREATPERKRVYQSFPSRSR